MKKLIILFSFSGILPFQLIGQSQAETYINEALGFLAQKNYSQAQLSLQDAINDLNNLIAEQIAEMLPDDVNGLKSVEGGYSGAGAMGALGGGMAISKNYKHPTKPGNEADLSILANSPMLSMMNMSLSNPGMMGAGYKSVRVGTYRSLLKSEMQDHYDDSGNSKQIRSTEIQIPLTKTLITLQLRGFASEQEEIAFATKLEIDKWKTLLGE